MVEDIEKQILELVTKDHKPGAIIMSPIRMKRFMKEPLAQLTQTNEGSGWAYQGVPVYRSWEIVGPVVVSRQVLSRMKREVRGYTEFSEDTPKRVQHDLLF